MNANRTSRWARMTGISAGWRLAAAMLIAVLSGAALAFTTPPTIDTTPAVITTAPQVVYVSDASATIRWVTDEIADSTVLYGVTGAALSIIGADIERKTEHLITLMGLAPLTAYSFAVASTDPSGNTVTSTVFNFTTVAAPDTTPPSFASGPTFANITGNAVGVNWTASEPSSAIVAYGTSAGALNQQITSAEFSSAHGVTLTNLSPGMTYFVAVTATDLAGNPGTSAILSFATLPPPPVATAPGAPTSVGASPGNTLATVSFAAPAANGGAPITSYTVTSSPGGITASGSASPITVTGLTNGVAYTFTVTASSSAGTGVASAASNSVTPFTNPSFTPALESGFNLLGNSLNTTLNVMTVFGNQTSAVGGITENIASVWKWDALNGRWQFHSPLLTTAANADHASAHNYDVLTTIAAGEGYWVNALTAMNLPPQTGSTFNWNSSNFAALPSGFNLIAHAGNITPSQFNTDVSATPTSTGVVATDNFSTLWAWDASNVTWFFYSPLLESSGGMPAVKSYADSHSFLHLQDFNKKIDVGVGFWVNKF